MTRWQGDSKKYTGEGLGSGSNFTPAPRGVYTVQVADYKDGKTANTGRNKVDLTLEIADPGPEFGKKVWLTITEIPKGEKGHNFMIHNIHAFGINSDDKYDFDTSEFQGRTARALLGVTTREKVSEKDGKTYVNEVNWVEDLYTESRPEPKGPLPPAREPRLEKKQEGHPGVNYAKEKAAVPSGEGQGW